MIHNNLPTVLDINLTIDEQKPNHINKTLIIKEIMISNKLLLQIANKNRSDKLQFATTRAIHKLNLLKSKTLNFGKQNAAKTSGQLAEVNMKYKILNISCAVLLQFSPQVLAITPVDVELQLLIDISGSISTSEYNLQMQGYSNAFASDTVQNAIINGTEGQIAVQLIMWSGASNQQVMIDWTLVDSIASADSFSSEILSIARPFSGMTAIGSAIEYAYPLFLNNDFLGTDKVIDISGDGTNNSGSSPAEAAANAISNGVDTINGIVISNNQTVIDQYYDEVIAGDSPFLLAPANFDEFQLAIENKIAAEIEGTIPQQAISIPEPSSLILFISTFLIFIRNKAIK